MPTRRGFTLIECMVCLALVSALLSIGPISCLDSRRVARQKACQSNLRQFGIASANYAVDFQDALASFTARAGAKIDGADAAFNDAKDDLQAVANQAAWAIRQLADRPDIRPISGWLPNPSYTHLVFNDYLQQRIPDTTAVCPEDSARAALFHKPKWNQKTRERAVNIPPAVDDASKRWPYSSSYQFVPAAYSRNQATAREGTTIAQGLTDDEYLVPKKAPFGRVKRISHVAFPNLKVMIMDTHDRHNAKAPLFYADPNAVQPLAFFDTSVQMITTAGANNGFRPNDPASPQPSTFTYVPSGVAKDWYPAPMNQAGDKDQIGYYRWTRGGLTGLDVQGKEVATQGTPAVADDALSKAQH